MKQTAPVQNNNLVCPTPSLVKRQETQTGNAIWTKGVCLNCGYGKADVDPDGILWCPACGYSKKGCYT